MKELTEAKQKAIELLARREHSRRELHEKLSARGVEHDIIELVLEEMVEKNYQSDQRFAELFTEQRINKGLGPIKIRAELCHRGIDSSLAKQVLDVAGVDWVSNAKQAMTKKFRGSVMNRADHTFLNKCRRFLYSRGFSPEQIREAMNHG